MATTIPVGAPLPPSPIEPLTPFLIGWWINQSHICRPTDRPTYSHHCYWAVSCQSFVDRWEINNRSHSLLGITFSQASAYYRDYPKDSKVMKAMVSDSLDTTQGLHAYSGLRLQSACKFPDFLESLDKSLIHLRFLNIAQFATLCFTDYFWIITCRTPANYAFLGTLAK